MGFAEGPPRRDPGARRYNAARRVHHSDLGGPAPAGTSRRRGGVDRNLVGTRCNRHSAKSGQHRQKLDRQWLVSAEVGMQWAEVASNLACVGQMWAKFRPNLKTWPHTEKCLPASFRNDARHMSCILIRTEVGFCGAVSFMTSTILLCCSFHVPRQAALSCPEASGLAGDVAVGADAVADVAVDGVAAGAPGEAVPADGVVRAAHVFGLVL